MPTRKQISARLLEENDWQWWINCPFGKIHITRGLDGKYNVYPPPGAGDGLYFCSYEDAVEKVWSLHRLLSDHQRLPLDSPSGLRSTPGDFRPRAEGSSKR